MKTPSLPAGKTRWIVIAVAGVAVAGILAFWLLRDRGKPNVLRLYGNVDIREVELAFRQSGRLTHMAFDEGDAVAEGTVMAQFIVDSTGRVEPGSFKVLKSDHDLFTAAVKSALPNMRFLPAEVGGRHVKQLVQQPFQFALTK